MEEVTMTQAGNYNIKQHAGMQKSTQKKQQETSQIRKQKANKLTRPTKKATTKPTKKAKSCMELCIK